MKSRFSSRPTFKPRLETLETRDCPSGAGIALFMESQTIQTGVNAMQAHANAASADFLAITKDVGIKQSVDLVKAIGEIQTVRNLNTQVQAEIASFKQAVFLVAGDGDQGDATFAIFAFFQVNGGFGSAGGGAAGKATSALNQVNGIASSTTLPNGATLASVFGGTITTIDNFLNS